MKNFKKIRLLWIIVLLIVVFNIIFANFSAGRYYSDIESAVKSQARYSDYVAWTTVTGEEGVVYVVLLADTRAIGLYNFHTKVTDGNTLYRLADEDVLLHREYYMIKMDTAPNSTEQVVFGVGESFAAEISEKAGIDAVFIPFEHGGNQYPAWFIISADGLDILPDRRSGYLIWEEFPPRNPIIGLAIFGVVIFFIVALFWKYYGNKLVIRKS